MTTRCHDMPFGAELLPDGGVRFRLWAPSARRVDVVLGGGSVASRRVCALHADVGGRFDATIEDAGAATRYAFRIDGDRHGDLLVPDPASRNNPEGVHAPSLVTDPRAYRWSDAGWKGRPWHEAVIYEMHLGTFTRAGTYAGAMELLDDLAALGATALELMPLASFAGARNWGYDGVLPFAPAAPYGTPDELKRFVEAAHARGLMVIADVVYNHFGPEGNYLGLYAREFFRPERHTPWGAAINFDGERSTEVRAFFIHNALYWVEEFHFDGLRLDAVHAIDDNSDPDIVEEIAGALRDGPGRTRHVHLIVENDANRVRYLKRDVRQHPVTAVAQWNDDFHHGAHVLATGERDGYYADYADQPLHALGRALAEGFVYQGRPSAFRGGEVRGEPSGMLAPAAFVDFLQTHDQVGNRALGERLVHLAPAARLRALTACLLLAPSPPMLWMGEEFGASAPFLYFCDFGNELAAAVREGRRSEFRRFARFADPLERERIPDPNDIATFRRSQLDWSETAREPHAGWLVLYRDLLARRRHWVEPLLARHREQRPVARFDVQGSLLRVAWEYANVAARDVIERLQLLACLPALGDRPAVSVEAAPAHGEVVFATTGADGTVLPADGVRWTLESFDA